MWPRRACRWLMSIPDHRGRRWPITAIGRSHTQRLTRGRRNGLRALDIFLGLHYLVIVFTSFAISNRLRTLGPSFTQQANAMLAGTVAIALLYPLGVILIGRLLIGAGLRRCLAGRVCPSCSYSFEGIAAEPDGCTLCPECAGAWRVADRARSFKTPLPLPAIDESGAGPLAAYRRAVRRWTSVVDCRGTRWPMAAAQDVHHRRLGNRIWPALVAWVVAIVVFFALDIGIVMLINGIGGEAALDRGGGTLAFLASALLTGLGWATMIRMSAPQYIAANLDAGFCPVCGRSIADDPRKPDGCTICPDCGAASHLPARETP